MNNYTKLLINSSLRPELINLREIKERFKRNGRLIARINSAFNLLMTVFVIVLLLGIVKEGMFSSYKIVSWVMSLVMGKKLPNVDNVKFSREMIRCISADVVVILMKLSLILITLLQMISVNHESRSALILLDDLFSQFEHSVHTELYQSVSYGNIPSVSN